MIARVPSIGLAASAQDSMVRGAEAPEHKRRSFIAALRVHAERFEDYPRIFHSLIGGLAQLAHAAINSMTKKSTSTWDAAPLRPSSRSAAAVGTAIVGRWR